MEVAPITTDSPSQANSSRRPSLEMTLIGLLALTATLIYLNSPAVVEVSHATVDPDGHVTATVDTCGYELSFSVDEIDSLVAIKVFDHHFRIRLGRHDCQRVIQVPLTGSLGQRLLIDGSTGQQLIGP